MRVWTAPLWRTLITPEGGYPESLALDPEDAKMYWIDYGGDDYGPRIRRAALDGTGSEDLVVAEDGWYHDMRSLLLDVRGGKMYWLADAAHETIYRANLDGSDVEDLLFPSYYAAGSNKAAGFTEIVSLALGYRRGKDVLGGTLSLLVPL